MNITSYSGFKCSWEVCIYMLGSREVHSGSDVYIKFTGVMNKENASGVCFALCISIQFYSESLYIVS